MGINVDEFKSVRFTAEVDDSSSKATDNKNAVINITDFVASSKTLDKVVQAMKVIENTNVETDNIDIKLTESKELLTGLTSHDALMVQNILNLTEIINSSEVSSNIDIITDGITISETTDFAKLVKSTVNNAIKIEDNLNNASISTRKVLHDFAIRLKQISDNISDIYTTDDYVYEYGAEIVDFNDSKALRSSILALAFKLEYISSFSWVDDDDVKTREFVSGNSTFEYNDIMINPATVLNKGKIFKLIDFIRFDNSKNYIVEGLELVSSLPVGYKESKKEDKDNVLEILSSIKNGTLYKDVEKIEDYDYQNSKIINKEKIAYLNLQNFFDSSTTLDISDFGSNFEMTCPFGTYDIAYSKIRNNAYCTGPKADIEVINKPTVDNSDFPKVIVKYEEKTNDIVTKRITDKQGIIDFYFND